MFSSCSFHVPWLPNTIQPLSTHSRHYPTTDDHYPTTFFIFYKDHRKSYISFIICVALWQHTFADDRDGDGGNHWGHVLDHRGWRGGTFLGSPMPAKFCFSTKHTFLEVAHTICVLLYSHDSISAFDSHQQ